MLIRESASKTHHYVVMLVCLAALSASGCGTIMHGNTQDIPITSTPAGAKAEVAGQVVITPATVTIHRNFNYSVTFTKEGYQTAVVQMRKTVDPWIFGNILVGGIPGIIVDMLTGSAAQLTPAAVHANLQPIRAAPQGSTTRAGP